MQKIGYCYKGRPIAETGMQWRGGRSPIQLIILIVLALLTITFIGWAAYELISVLSASSPEDTVEPAEPPAENTVEPGTAPADEPASDSTGVHTANNPVPSGSETTRTADRVPDVAPQMLQQVRRVFAAAQAQLNRRDYAGARKTIRPVFTILPAKHPLYSDAQKMLSEASMSLYRRGGAALQNTVEYTVQSGNNLSTIARKYKVSVPEIQRANGMASTDTALRVGQKLRIPQNTWRITIQKNDGKLFLYSADTLFKIYDVALGSDIRAGSRGDFLIETKDNAPVWNNAGILYRAGSRENVYGDRRIVLVPATAAPRTNSGLSIHGTNNPASLAQSGTGPGGVRMSNSDIQELFSLVPTSTQVRIDP